MEPLAARLRDTPGAAPTSPGSRADAPRSPYRTVRRTFGLRDPRAPDARRRGRLVPADRDELGRARRSPPAGGAARPDRARGWSTWACRCSPRPAHPAFLGALDRSREIIWLIVPLLIVFYAGELVWREREAGLSEIADAAPVPDVGPLRGQVPGARPRARRAAGAADGGGDARAGAPGLLRLRDRAVPARSSSGSSSPTTCSSPCSALAVHVLVNQKYVGHLVVLVAYVFIAFGPAARDRAQPARLRLRSRLGVLGHARLRPVRSGRGSGSSSTGRRGRCCSRSRRAVLGAGHGAGPRVAAPTGAPPLHARDARRPPRWRSALILALGGFIFYNTNVLNAYRHRRRQDGAERRVRAALRAVRRASRSRG